MTRPTMPNEYPNGSFAGPVPAPVSARFLEALESAQVAYDVSDGVRADHGRDWWPITIRDVAAGRVPQWPGVVVRPTRASELPRILAAASDFGIAVTPQGGRSGVAGGALAPPGAIALDLGGLDQILDVDAVSGTVRVEAGLFGPDLERHVNTLGWTVGHFPQSFELATVGGWIACRGAGQFSNRYGKIEDIVRGLRVVLADGTEIDVGGRGPRQAVGPDLVALFVGSEGTLGVITQATLVMQPLPAFERRAAYAFATFDEGLEACRRIMQRGARPAVLRLYDEKESQRNFEVGGCALIVLDEGDELLVEAAMTIVDRECAGGDSLETELVARWLTHRNDVGALAPLWEHGVVVDTIEVAGPWATLPPMRRAVTSALLALPDMTVATVHQSHAYLDGACLYFTFAGRPTDDVPGFYRTAWDVATAAVLECGGALSHHHGVGRNRARFVSSALDTAYPLLVAMKAVLDPMGIMNPGVLGLGGPPW